MIKSLTLVTLLFSYSGRMATTNTAVKSYRGRSIQPVTSQKASVKLTSTLSEKMVTYRISNMNIKMMQ